MTDIVTVTTPGVRVVDLPDLGVVNDASSMVGERIGSGKFSATRFRDYANLIIATGSITLRSNADRWSTIANVLDYGALGDGVANDTVAIQAAITTGKTVYMPKGTYRVTDAINCTTMGQIIEGAGKAVTIIAIGGDFNLSALGVFVTPAGPWVPGPQFRDFQMNFTQPDTATYGSLTVYPPAFYMQGVARSTWHRVKINAAKMGIDLRGNAAGCSIVDCELCCFDWHIYLDGEADSITVQGCRFENDLLTVNQSTIYHAVAVGIMSGRCDDLHVAGCLFFCGVGIELFVGVDTNVTNASVTNCDFDTYSGIKVDAGNLQVSACSFTFGAATDFGLLVSAGNISVSACWFLCGVALTNAIILTSAIVEARLQVTACRFDLAGSTTAVNSFFNSTIILTGCDFNVPQVVRPTPVIAMNTASLLTMNGCRLSAKGAGTGQCLNLVADGTHNICGNSFGGWDVAFFAGGLHIIANNNP